MSRHAGEWMRVSDVSRTLAHSESRITAILSTLAEGYVLLSEGDRFRYDRDPLVDMDIKRFMARSEAHNQFAQNNLARYRDRFGQH
jgi:hypothetical protein